MAAHNQAAWITAAAAHPFSVQDAPYPTPGPGEIVIKNAAIAINPVDWKIQKYGAYVDKYPFILGEDTAGVVVETGPGVSRFSKGQRVLAYCHGLGTKNPANSAFQLYSLADENIAAVIPDSVSFEEAAVLPLALSTAAAGLFFENNLNLPLPGATDTKSTGKTILIWGGASSVGAAAIQLAVAAGVRVISTASARNHGLVKSLGASAVFDYKSSTVVEDISNALAGTEFVGVFDSISESPSFDPIKEVLNTLKAKVKVISVLTYQNPTEQFAPIMVMAFNIAQQPHKHVAEGIWRDFVPKALENGRLKAKPDPEVVGKGLGDIQHAVDTLKKGVSAKKIVVTL